MTINIPKINLSKNLIPAAIVVAGILIAGAFVYIKYFPLGTLSSQEAAEKAMAFINENIEEGAVASLVQVTEEKDFYKVGLTITFNGVEKPYESYITKDGKFLFPSGINLEASAAPEETTEAVTETSAVASDTFAQCLTEKGMKFYGSKNCSWCSKEKEAFGTSLQYVNYIECVGDDGQWTKECQDAQITSVPTWQLPDGTKESGYKTLEQLAEKSGCSL